MSKKKSIFKEIIQIKGDHPPSYPIFDKFWLGRAPTLPTEFLTKTQQIKQHFIIFCAWNLTQHEKFSQNKLKYIQKGIFFTEIPQK